MVGIIILMWWGISQNNLPTASCRVLLRQYWPAVRDLLLIYSLVQTSSCYWVRQLQRLSLKEDRLSSTSCLMNMCFIKILGSWGKGWHEITVLNAWTQTGLCCDYSTYSIARCGHNCFWECPKNRLCVAWKCRHLPTLSTSTDWYWYFYSCSLQTLSEKYWNSSHADFILENCIT